MQIDIFGKPDCEFCKTTMQKFETFMGRWNIEKSLVALNFIDVSTVDGLTEGAMNEVIKIPTTIIRRDGNIMARWDGKVPLSEEFKNFFEDLKPQEKTEIN